MDESYGHARNAGGGNQRLDSWDRCFRVDLLPNHGRGHFCCRDGVGRQDGASRSRRLLHSLGSDLQRDHVLLEFGWSCLQPLARPVRHRDLAVAGLVLTLRASRRILGGLTTGPRNSPSS